MTATEIQTLRDASYFLMAIAVSDRHGGGVDQTIERLEAIIATNVVQPLVPPGSEVFMRDFIAQLVGDPLIHDDVAARVCVEGGAS